MQGILAAGGLPVMLPLTTNRTLLAQMAQTLDGFLFTGGHDVSPALYGETPLPACGACCAQRDEMESTLLPLLLEKDVPVLGICRGIQFLNAALGGTLYQDLPTQAPSALTHHQAPPYDAPVHTVLLVENTPLHALPGETTIAVNSYHHQTVKTLAPSLRAMAYATDGLVEAAYMLGKKYVWAVQWHPEFSFLKDANSRTISEQKNQLKQRCVSVGLLCV